MEETERLGKELLALANAYKRKLSLATVLGSFEAVKHYLLAEIYDNVEEDME